MHELFTQVLTNRDLSKAGDLFNVPDTVIVNDLIDVIQKICDIASLPDYTRNDNDQSVVEICITRVTSAVRETGSIEQHAEALVSLLQLCLNYNLRPTSRDEDPPHSKIASDVVSCIFLNYHKRNVMALALPVAVKFLHKGNRELSRSMSSYLALAAIDAADLLSLHVQPIIDSVISGNYSLSRVLPQIYEVKKSPVHDHVMTLVSILPQCDTNEKLGLLSLFSLVAKNKPALLEPSLPQLVECLAMSGTSLATLQILVELCTWRPAPFTEHIGRLKAVAEQQPHCLSFALQIIGSVGRLSKENGKASLDYITQQLPKVDSNNLGIVLRDIQNLCSQYPALLTDSVITSVSKVMDRANSSARGYIQQLKNEYNEIRNTNVNHTPGGVTIVRVSGGSRADGIGSSKTDLSYPNRDIGLFQSNVGVGCAAKLNYKYQKHSDTSRSTGRLVTASNRSMPRLNALPHSAGRLGSSSIQLNKSMTHVNSSHGLAMNRSVTVLAPSYPTRHFSGHLPPAGSVAGSFLGGSQFGGSRLVSSPPLTHPLPATPAAVTSNSLASSPLPGLFNPSKSTSSSVATLRDGPDISMTQSHSTLIEHPPLVSTAVTMPASVVHHTLSLPHRMPSRELGPLSLPVTSDVSPLRHLQSPLPLCAFSSVGTTTVSTVTAATILSSGVINTPSSTCDLVGSAVSTSGRRLHTNTTLTHITTDTQASCSTATTQRISVFEPCAMRDTVQHFCEKHLDKIKAYMQKVFVKLPLPIRCGIEDLYFQNVKIENMQSCTLLVKGKESTVSTLSTSSP